MRALVAGGGIGGLTTAVVLGRRGLACELFEAGAAERDQGAGLLLAPNALETLRRLGLYEKVRDAGFEPRVMMVARADGRPLQRTEAEVWRQRYGFAPVAIHRAALHRLLLEALAATAVGDAATASGGAATVVHHGAPLAGFTDEAGAPVGVVLADGRRVEGDLLVAADGLRSRIRESLIGPTRLRYAGQTSWRGIAELRLDGSFGDALVELWGRERGLRFGVAPVDARRSYWFATVYAPPGGSDASVGAALDGLRAAFSGFVPEVRALLDKTERLVRTDIFDFAPLASWHRGRVVLTGDAAHATTPNLGQGANQAIESAYVLAQALADKPLAEALAAYETIRMAKAHWITKQSWRFGQLTNLPGPIGRWLRYSVVPRAPRSTVLKQTDRMFALAF